MQYYVFLYNTKSNLIVLYQKQGCIIPCVKSECRNIRRNKGLVEITPINIWTSDKDVNLPLLGSKTEDLFCLMSITMLGNTAQLTQASLFLSEYKHYYQTLFPRRDKDFTNQKTKTKQTKKQKLLNQDQHLPILFLVFRFLCYFYHSRPLVLKYFYNIFYQDMQLHGSGYRRPSHTESTSANQSASSVSASQNVAQIPLCRKEDTVLWW